jgi:hypothetical protein
MAKVGRYFKMTILFFVFFNIIAISFSFSHNTNMLFVDYYKTVFSPKKGIRSLFSNGSALIEPINSTSSCVTPSSPSLFYNQTQNPCLNVPFQYSFPKVEDADGYVWSFLGDGAQIKLVSSSELDPFVDFISDTVFNSNDANDIFLKFKENFVSGTLSVKSYTFCVATNQFEYSSELVIQIHKDNSVQFLIPNDTTFNCQLNTVSLNASCNGENPSYSWNCLQNSSVNGSSSTLTASIQDNLSTTNSISYQISINYTLNSKTECNFKDTVNILIDTVKPKLILDQNNPVLNCYTPTININGISSSANVDVHWNVLGLNLETPLSIDTINFEAGLYYFIGQNSLNFCSDSISLNVIFDFSKPNAPLLNGEIYTNGIPFNTIDCNNEQIPVSLSNLNGENNSFVWISTGYPNSVDFNSNHLMDSILVNGENGCTAKFEVFMNENKTLPEVYQMADTLTNCSHKRISLLHPTNENSLSGWVGYPYNPELISIPQGTYVYEYINSENGCRNYDTVVVGLSYKIDIAFTPHETICKGGNYSLQSLSIVDSKFEKNYFWDGFPGGTSYSFTATEDTYITLEISTLEGCYGIDSIFFDVQGDFDGSVTQFTNCGTYIGAEVNITGNYTLPIYYKYNDQTSYTESNKIIGLDIGEQLVTVMDGSGCRNEIHFNTHAIETDSPPSFMASTYNFASDLVALVNVSEIAYDSIHWVLPVGITFEYESDSIRYVSAIDTGIFDVTMIAFLDSCQFNVTKSIYFGDSLPVNFQIDGVNGIQSLDVYPNPTSSTLSYHIVFGVEQNYICYITDILGNVLVNKASNLSIEETHTFDLTNLSSGTYVLHLVSDFDSVYKTIIKN